MLKRRLIAAIGTTLLASCSAQETTSLLSAGDAAIDNSVLLFKLSEDVFKTAGARNFEEPATVDRWLNGAYMRGDGTSHIWTDFETTPSSNSAQLDTLTYSNTNTNTWGNSNGVGFCFHNTVNTGSRTSLRIAADRGIWLEPSASNVSVDIRLTCVDVGQRLLPRLAERRARNEINARLPGSRQIVFQETQAETNRRLDEEANSRLDDPGIAQLEKMRTDFIAGGMSERLGFSTSADALRITIGHTGELPARPTLPAEADVTIAFHSSMMNEYLSTQFAAQTMTQIEFDTKFRDLMGSIISQPAGSALPPTDTDDPSSDDNENEPSITFAASNPVTFSIQNDSVTITIRGDHWTTPNNIYQKKMDVSAVYQRVETPEGISLQREDTITVVPRDWTPEDGPLPIRTQIIAGVIKEQFNDKLHMSMVETNLTLEGYLAGAGAMRLNTADAKDGWLVLGYQGSN